MSVHINKFYENKTTHRIVRCVGWSGLTKLAYLAPEVRPNQDIQRYGVTESELESDYQLRSDLEDWPDAWDPKLPYVFDLNWDLKTESDLVRFCAEEGYRKAYDNLLVQYGREPIKNRLKQLKVKYGIN